MSKAIGIKTFIKLAADPNTIILDTRLPDYFENGFIPNSINIGFKPGFEAFVNLLLEPTNTILLVCKANTETEVVNSLIENGYNNIAGYLQNGFDAWLNYEQPYDMLISISGEEACLDALYNEKAVIIDIRASDVYANAHLHKAINIPLTKLNQQISQLDKTAETILYSQNGYESMIAASLLKNAGFKNIKNVWGGFDQIVNEEKAVIAKL